MGEGQWEQFHFRGRGIGAYSNRSIYLEYTLYSLCYQKWVHKRRNDVKDKAIKSSCTDQSAR